MSARRNHRVLPRLERLEQRYAPSLTPVGPEFRVNVSTVDFQWMADVAADAQGHFLVAYAGVDEDIGYAALVQRYDSEANSLGDPITVGPLNALTDPVKIAINANGQFVVAWDYYTPVGNPSGYTRIYYRRYDSNAQPIGPATALPLQFQADMESPDVAIDNVGNFALTWTYRLSANLKWIGARWYSAVGPPIGDVFVSFSGQYSSIAASPTGSYVIAWQSTDGLRFQNFGPNREFVGQEVHYSNFANVITSTAVTFNSEGDIVAVWYEPSAIKFRRFNSNGTALGSSTDVAVTGNTLYISISGSTDTVVTWAAQEGILARQFSIDGQVSSPIVLASSPEPHMRIRPNVGVDPDGDTLIAWDSFEQDGDGWGVYAQRFAGSSPGVWNGLINNGSPQRSSVTNTTLNFNRTLVLPSNPSDAFSVTSPFGDVPFQLDLSASTPAGTVANIVFPGGLPNGHYNLTVHASIIHDTAGQVMGADYVMPFHRLLGDFNGDGRVDSIDFTAFRTAFGTVNTTFDLDGDGHVGASDFMRFREVFGLWI